jgi:hypothetical protein
MVVRLFELGSGAPTKGAALAHVLGVTGSAVALMRRGLFVRQRLHTAEA